MLTWIAMRQCALMRHRWWHKHIEGGEPSRWRTHQDMVRLVYGW